MWKPSLPCSGPVTVNEFLFVMLQIVLMTDQEPEILSGLPSQPPNSFEISRELGYIPFGAGREPVIAFSFDPDKSSLAFDEAIRVSRAFQLQLFRETFCITIVQPSQCFLLSGVVNDNAVDISSRDGRQWEPTCVRCVSSMPISPG